MKVAAFAMYCLKPLIYIWFRKAIVKKGWVGVTVGSVRSARQVRALLSHESQRKRKVRQDCTHWQG